MRTHLRIALLAAIGIALVALVAFGLVVLGWSALPLDRNSRVQIFAASECVAGLLWWRAVVLVRGGLPSRGTIWIVLAAAAAMRALTLSAPPLLSSDMYRYVWDGRVQQAGINPYRYVPAAPQLAFLRDRAVYPNINRPNEARTIYPPAAELVFAAAAVIAPGVLGMKLVMAGFDALAIVVLLTLLRRLGRDPAEVVAYAWLPLPVWEFAGNAHIDAAAAGLLALALLFSAHGRSAATGCVLAAATLTKLLPAVVLPAFWRPRDRALPTAFLLTVIAFYLPYISVSWHVLGFLPSYVTQEHIATGGGVYLLEVLHRMVPLPDWAVPGYAALTLAALALLAVRFTWFANQPAEPAAAIAQRARHAGILAAVLLVALSPHYPWYFGWLAPLACLASLPSLYWLVATAPLLVLGPIEHLLVPTIVYVPAAALALLGHRRTRQWSPA